jgi:hypothetical protein
LIESKTRAVFIESRLIKRAKKPLLAGFTYSLGPLTKFGAVLTKWRNRLGLIGDAIAG